MGNSCGQRFRASEQEADHLVAVVHRVQQSPHIGGPHEVDSLQWSHSDGGVTPLLSLHPACPGLVAEV